MCDCDCCACRECIGAGLRCDAAMTSFVDPKVLAWLAAPDIPHDGGVELIAQRFDIAPPSTNESGESGKSTPPTTLRRDLMWSAAVCDALIPKVRNTA